MAATATFLNIMIIRKRFIKKDYSKALLDTAVFIGANTLFVGSTAGLVIAQIASMMFSAYLTFDGINLKMRVTN
jgi:hypothetical protein